jgi:diguanylate cyclase (GGDEF)-like protein
MLEHHGRVEGFETRFHFPDGSLRNVLLAANVMTVDGDDDVVVIVFADITSHKETEAHLERLAATDPLTGLANRVKFFAIAESEIRRAERYERPVAVAMIDIDFFKRINDAYGHEAGDMALKAFADVCRTLVREQDVVARLGGEEFALLLPETDRVSAFVLVERLRSSVEDLRLDWLSTPMTVSIGVSEVIQGEISVDAALARADQALYVAKRSGRNQTVHFDYTESARSEALAG